MTYYIFADNGLLNGAGQCKCLNMANIEVTEFIYNDYIATPNKYMYEEDEIVLNPNYEEEQRQKEQERKAMLNLTRGDVFIGLIKARMMDENTLRAQLEQMPEETDEQKIEKMLALNALSNALNFHRGHSLVNIIGQQLGISSENLDMFFETNDYHYLLPVEPDETEEEIEE